MGCHQWLESKLILHDRLFCELIDAFRPYRTGILSISAEAARLQLNGAFNLDRMEDFPAMVPELFPMRVLQIGRLFKRIDLMRI